MNPNVVGPDVFEPTIALATHGRYHMTHDMMMMMMMMMVVMMMVVMMAMVTMMQIAMTTTLIVLPRHS